jgi:FkbM family methyltransferase
MWNEMQFGIGIQRTVAMRPGWALVCHPSAFTFAYRAQQNDPDQVGEFDGFISLCQPGMVLFDVGAHFGLFSLAALHYGGADAKAVAVDPSPAACRMMCIQAKLNGGNPRIAIVQACAGDRIGWKDMVDSGVQSASYFVPPAQDHTSGELTRTRSITIDGLAAKFEIQPTHIKIDVEGSEEAVVRGGRSTLARTDGPLLFLELHNQIVSNRGGNPGHVLGLLRELGYGTATADGLPIDDATILTKPLIRVMARKKAIANTSKVA